jgi:NAD-dependent dihydropyrimidine dehydrogenase PreA subunit
MDIRFGTARVFARLCLNAKRGPDTPNDEDDPPCDRCLDWCKVEGAIKLGGGGVPVVDADKCTGCGLCVAHCKAYPRALGFEPSPPAARAPRQES